MCYINFFLASLKKLKQYPFIGYNCKTQDMLDKNYIRYQTKGIPKHSHPQIPLDYDSNTNRFICAIASSHLNDSIIKYAVFEGKTERGLSQGFTYHNIDTSDFLGSLVIRDSQYNMNSVINNYSNLVAKEKDLKIPIIYMDKQQVSLGLNSNILNKLDRLNYLKEEIERLKKFNSSDSYNIDLFNNQYSIIKYVNISELSSNPEFTAEILNISKQYASTKNPEVLIDGFINLGIDVPPSFKECPRVGGSFDNVKINSSSTNLENSKIINDDNYFDKE